MTTPSLHDVTVVRGGFTLTCPIWCTEPGLTAVVGLNGAGKTTLLQVLSGSVTPTSGEVALQPRTQVLPQGAALSTAQSPWALYRYVAALRGVPRSQRQSEAERVMAMCGLGARAQTPFDTLSGGWKQRTLLGQTLIGDPSVLILDEPTASLDVAASREVWSMMRELAVDLPLIVATHEASASLEFCDRLVAVTKGNVTTARSGEELRTQLETHRGSAESFLLDVISGDIRQ